MSVLQRRTHLCFRKVFLGFNMSNTRGVSQVFLTLKPARETVKSVYVGLGLGTITGAIYAGYKTYSTKSINILNNIENVKPVILKEFPKVDISRKISLIDDTSGLKLTLFQYPTCPFCCKVRAFLDYFGISYDVVEVNPVLRQQIKWSSYKKVPILLSETDEGYQQLYDSSMIVSALATYLRDKSTPLSDIVQSYPTIVYYDDGKQKHDTTNRYFVMGTPVETDQDKQRIQDERKWRIWADDSLVHTLSPNVYRSVAEAKQAFNWFAEVGEWHKLFPTWETLLIINVGAYAMWIISKRLKKRHNLKSDVRQSLYDECEVLLKEIRKRKSKFLGGEKPNLADISIYGVLSSIEGCTAFVDLLENTRIGTWYFEMQNQVKNHNGRKNN